MPLYNGGRIGSNNKPFTGTKSDDPNYSNVSLLLNGNGSNGSTTFTDSSSYSHTITPVGNTQISTAQSKFGGASMYFDGSGDYLTIPDDTSFHFGSDSFTIEFWIYRNSTAIMNITNKRPSSASNTHWIWFAIRDTGVLHLWATSNGSTWDIASDFNFGNTALSTGQWYHIALVRNGTEFATYVDGTKSPNTFTSSAIISTGGSNTVQIGGDPAYNTYYVNGYIDDFRITKGVARYTSNFTPPTAQLPGGETGTFASGLWTLEEQSVAIRKELWPGLITGIVTDGLVVHLDAEDTNSYPGSGTTWTDLSGNGNNATLFGSPSYTASPGYFDITSDSTYARLSSYSHGTNDFTYSMWVRFDAFDGTDTLFENGSWTDCLLLRVQNTTSIAVYTEGALRGTFTWNPSVGNWYNVVYTRSGSTNTLYVNGTQSGSTFTDQTNISIANAYTFLMRSQHTSNQFTNGQLAQYAMYSKALTPTEITQNFNALKGRYGL